MPEDFDSLIKYIQQFPGIGPKAASRIAFFLITENKLLAKNTISALDKCLQTIGVCSNCGNISTLGGVCSICSDFKRDHTKIALVAGIGDILAIEKSGAYDGLYYVYSHYNDLFENKDRFDKDLFQLNSFIASEMSSTEKPLEVIFALPYSIDTEVACSVISDALKSLKSNVNISRIALGMPSGADFDYTDKLTIMKSFKGRTGVY